VSLAEPTWEEIGRAKKVTRLVAVLAPVLREANCPPELIDDEVWDLATRKAGLKKGPSAETKSQVLRALGAGPVPPHQETTANPGRSRSDTSETDRSFTDSERSAAREGQRVHSVKQPQAESAVSIVSSGGLTPSVPAADTPCLFDLDTSRRYTEAAIKRVEQAAGEDWNERALEAVRRVAESQSHFIVDDCWAFVEEPREPRAMGAVINKARRLGIIAATDEYRPSSRVSAHSNPRRVWRSLISVAVAS
jgi:hypothetical protein